MKLAFASTLLARRNPDALPNGRELARPIWLTCYVNSLDNHDQAGAAVRGFPGTSGLNHVRIAVCDSCAARLTLRIVRNEATPRSVDRPYKVLQTA
jgi:hypothetical protein